MKEIFEPFTSLKKLKLMAICALIFIGMAIPFKVMVLIEGFTEVRPVNAVPVVVGLLFGPIGAWGCAIGNLIADLFGTFSASSSLGFIGNFIAAYLPYKMWRLFEKKEELPNVKNSINLCKFIIVSAIAAFATAVIIAYGIYLIFGPWIPQLFWIVICNDFGFSIIIGLPIFIVLTSEENKPNAVTLELYSRVSNKKKSFLKVFLPVLFLSISEVILVIIAILGVQNRQLYLLYPVIGVFLVSLIWLIGPKK